MHKKLFLISITIFMSYGVFSSDIYLPVQPLIQNALSSSETLMHFSYALFFFGYSSGYLLFGTCADYFSRKRLANTGFALFIAGSLLCALGSNIYVFIAARFLQSLGAAVGAILGRIIISDLFEQKDIARIFTLMFSVIGFSPSLAPLLGGALSGLFSWKAIFIFLSIIGIINYFSFQLFQPDNIKKHLPIPHKPNINKILTNYRDILSSKIFIGYAFVSATIFAAYFCYMVKAPYILARCGYSIGKISFSYFGFSFVYFLSNMFVKKLLARYSFSYLIKTGLLIFCSSSLLMLLLTWTFKNFSIIFFILPMNLCCIANAFILPISSAAVINQFRTTKGYASGLLGAVQFSMIGFSLLALQWTKNSPILLSLYLLFLSASGAVFFCSKK